ncbi:hypothetical protein GYMLUDRAFT_159890 [Collybiopsis luxurians FD-317 M1]|nr:hypothetical protein GYMLUDRAFT_159890 [Collybiopsis luxurians FD-317 M1]
MIPKSLGVALVTGAGQGIGKAIAMRLASDGFKVALNDVAGKKRQLEDVAQEIDSKYNRGSFVAPGDVSQEEDVKEMVEAASKSLGGLDVMVANAGILGASKPVVSTTIEEWDHLFRVNTRGIFLCYKYAALEMISQKRGGRIIGASSLAGKLGSELLGAYTASKFAVRGLTQTAALELGEHGITVNAYAPGEPFLRLVLRFTLAQEHYERLLPPFAKYGKPEDISSIISYLASKEAYYITGESLTGVLWMAYTTHAADSPGQAVK